MTKNYNKIVPNNLILFIVFMGFGVYYYCFSFFCRDTISLWDIPRELISKRNWFSQARQIAGYVEAPPRRRRRSTHRDKECAGNFYKQKQWPAALQGKNYSDNTFYFSLAPMVCTTNQQPLAVLATTCGISNHLWY